MLGLFRIKKEERLIAFTLLLVFVALNAMLIYSHYGTYTMGAKGGYWTIFTNNFRMSGYDNWSWITLSGMRVHFETVRHPLFLSLLYPFYHLNHLLIKYADLNAAVFITAMLQLFSAFYSVVFMYRIGREVIGLERRDAHLITLFLFSFAHILLPTMVPDHFVISLMFLLMTLYICGVKMRKNELLNHWQAFWLIFFTAGMAASNAAKTLLAGLFTNGRRFFTLKYFLIGFLLPAALLVGIQQLQYYTIEVPQKADTKRMVENRKKKQPNFFKKYSEDREKWLKSHTGVKTDGNAFEKLIDLKTSRPTALVENFFGESIQLHQEYLLKDVSWDRPVVVTYSWIANYIVEALILLLFLMGIVVASKERFFQMLLLWFACDLTLHIVLGFGINEVYIMTAGWAFIIPIACGYLLLRLAHRPRTLLRYTLSALTCALWVYNVTQIALYLL